MDCITVLAQAYETSSAQASDAVVPIDTFWKYITSLNAVEAVTFISFGVVCLCYGWRVFKVLVVISFALLGLFLGVSISNQIVGLNSQLFGGLIGMLVLGVLSVPLIKWSVCILGAAAGGIMSSGVWYACGLTERYIMAGALIGIIAGGMISFIVFKIAVMLFSSLGGSTLMVVGALALLHLYPSTKVGVEEMVFTRKWFLPLTLVVPTVIGLIMQNRFVKDSKDWDL